MNRCSVKNCDSNATYDHTIEFEDNTRIVSEVCSTHAFLIKNSEVQYNSVEDL